MGLVCLPFASFVDCDLAFMCLPSSCFGLFVDCDVNALLMEIFSCCVCVFTQVSLDRTRFIEALSMLLV